MKSPDEDPKPKIDTLIARVTIATGYAPATDVSQHLTDAELINIALLLEILKVVRDRP